MIRKVLKRLKAKIYKTTIRLVMVYRKETCEQKNTEERNLERTKMRILREAMGITLKERLRNEEVRRRAGVECITEVIRKSEVR